MDEKDGSIIGSGLGACRGRRLLGALVPLTESDPGAVRHPDSGGSPCARVGDSPTAGARTPYPADRRTPVDNLLPVVLPICCGIDVHKATGI
jgi:hypothetical protein